MKKKPETGKTAPVKKSGAGSGRSGASAQRAKKQTSGKKASAPPRAPRQEAPAETPYEGAGLAREAMMWVMIAVGIFLFISYFGLGGFLGEVISDVSFGLFGWSAYAFPFLIIVATAFLISNRGSKVAVVKFLSAVVLYLTVCSFFGLAKAEEYTASTVLEIYERSAAQKAGGGAIGGQLCRLLCPSLGTVGAAVFLGILAVICVVLITQRSILRGVKRRSQRMYAQAKEHSLRRREEQAARQEEEDEYLPIQDRDASRAAASAPGIEREPVRYRRSEAAASAQEQQSRWSMSTARLPKAEEEKAGSGRHAGARGRAGSAKKPRRSQEVPQPELIVEGSDAPVVRHTQRTEIEIPVIFPSTPQESRHSRRVNGMTDNTLISGNPGTVGADVHEIISRGSHAELSGDAPADTEPAAGIGNRDAHRGVQDTPDGQETTYIDLDRIAADQTGDPYIGAQPDGMALHIEGISDDPTDDRQQPESPTVESTRHDPFGFSSAETAEHNSFGSSQEESAERDPYGARTAESDEQEADGKNTRTAGHRAAGAHTAEHSASGTRIPEYRTSDDSDEADEAYAAGRGEEQTEHGSSADSSGAASGRSKDFGIFASENRLDGNASGAVFRSEPSAPKSRTAGGREGTESRAADGEEPHGSSPKRNPRSSKQEIEEGIADVEAEMAKAAEVVKREYVYPPLDLLKRGTTRSGAGQEQEVRRTAAKLQQTLDSFGVHARVTNVSCGPSVTRYELTPEQGVKVKQIVALADDIKLNLAATDIRIEAPIPGKSAVGIEVPNAENSTVMLRDLLESNEFKTHKSNLAFAVGKDIGGKTVVADIAKMPHLLIAGATGSGKSVCINTLIMSILYKAKPDDVKLIMVDPKVVELSVYNGIPHLFIPVVTDPKKAAGALNWAVAEMDSRYQKFAEYGVRDLKGYNQKIEAIQEIDDPNKPQKLPQIVIIVDELADLMMVAPGEVEDSICRLAQLARAAGLHLIIATQRPSVNVITGLIKANMPSRIAFAVSSGVDSRTIIDMYGAEKLLGKGDMLFYPQGYQKPARVQGAFVSDEEVSDVVDFLKEKNMDGGYGAEMEEQLAKVQQAGAAARANEDVDALFAEAGKFIIDKDKASIGMLQRVFKIGFNRAARIMDQLSDAGVVGPEEGTKPRKILMSQEEFENYLEQN